MLRSRWTWIAPCVAGALLWIIGAAHRSLWTDEFHSLHHVRAPDWSAFLAAVRADNHPPLGFALQRLSVLVFGESELALRLPGVLAGIALVALTTRLADRIPGRAARRLAPWLVACSSYTFLIATEARMYAWLALAVLGLALAVLEQLEGRASRVPARWQACAWIAVGFHAHYYFLHDLWLIGLGTLAAVWWRRELAARAAELLLPASVAALLCLPWACWGFFPQLFHELPAGGNYHGLGIWVQSIAHLAFLNASLGGRFVTYGVALPGAVLLALLLAAGTLRLARMPRARLSLLFLLALAVGAPAWSYGVSCVWSRAAYGWPYLAGSEVPLLCIAAAGVGGSTARWLAASALAGTMLAVTLVGAAWGGTEDFRTAVELVLAEARPGDAVVAKPLWELEPERSPTGWDFYLERAAPAIAPVLIPVAELERARRHERVWVLIRDQHSPWILRALRRSFQRERRWRLGTSLDLHLFSEPRDAPAGQRGVPRAALTGA